MAKRKKEEEEVPERDWEAELYAMTKMNQELVRRLRYANYLTPEQFANEYSQGLRLHLMQQFPARENGDNLCHPEDLAAAAATFSDAHWNMHQAIDYHARGTDIGKP